MGLHDWFLKSETRESPGETRRLTPNTVYKYIVDKFEESVQQLSFAQRVVFYHEYISQDCSVLHASLWEGAVHISPK